MIKRTIEISSPARLSIAARQLVIARPDQPDVGVPCEDIGVLVVDHPQASYTQAVFTHLLEAGAAVVVCGANHLPAGLMLPLDAHTTQTEKHRAQVEASEPTRKRVWQTLVQAKIRQQGHALAHYEGNDFGLGEIARRVRSGDPDNLEGQAAQRYWPRLLGRSFSRSREGPAPNDLLNYGYAVLRATVARAIVASGLIPTLGVFHRHRNNPFCLADDLLEPYRPFVDWRVRGLRRDDGTWPAIERDSKTALLSLLNETVLVGRRRSPLLLAIQSGATSLARALTGEGARLALPSGMPVAEPPDADEGDDDEGPEEEAGA